MIFSFLVSGEVERMRAIFAGAAFTLLVMTNAALAQNPAATAPGGAGGPARVAGQGRNGGQGRGGGRNAMGTITGGDMKAGTMVISSQFGGGSQTIKVNPDTKFTTQQIVTVGSLRAGDQVQVQGVPAVITASSITAGELPDFLQNNRNRGGRGAAPGGATPATPGAAADTAIDPNNPPQPTASATATGKVVSTNPLTIVINTNVTIILKLASGVKITKLSSVPFSSLKVGDKLIASGTTDPDGTFIATGVGVNLDMGGRGMGAFGGRGGGGQGGQGGGRNRGNRAGAGANGANGATTGGDIQNPPTK